MPDATSFARLIDAVPQVANAAARDALFTNPAINQLVRNLGTRYVESWDGNQWTPDGVIAGLGPAINVRTKGALGDGVTDDSVAISKAITDAIAAQGVVYFPASQTEYIATNIQATGGTASTVLRFRGDGHGSKVKLKAGAATSVFFITGIGGVVFTDMLVDGNKANCPAGLSAIRSDVSDTMVRGCKVQNGNQDAIFITPDGLSGTLTAVRATIIGNHFVNCGNASYGGVAVAAEQVQGLVVANNVADGMGGGLCDVEPFGAAAASDSIAIIGNTVRGTLSWGVPGAIQVTSENASNPAGTGVNAVDHVVIAGNVINGTAGAHGIYVQASRRTLVTGNYVYGAWQNGIFVDADTGRESKYVSVLGNVVIDPSAGAGGFDAIRLNNAQSCVVSDNACLDTRGVPLMARAIREQGTSTGNYFGPVFALGATVETITLVGTPGIVESAGPHYIGGLLRVRAQGAARYRGDVNVTSTALNINAFDDTGGVPLPIAFGSHKTDSIQALGGTATPSVAGGDLYTVAASGTAVTDFAGLNGQTIMLQFSGARTITNGATIKLNGAVNFVGAADNTLTLTRIAGIWYERSRKV